MPYKDPEKKKLNRKRYHLKNPSRSREYRFDNPERAVLWNARKNAKTKGVAFDLELSDIVIPNVCPALGIPIVKTSTEGIGRTDNSPSVDRLDPTKGYVKDNVRIVSWRANKLKGDATPEELEKIAAYTRQQLSHQKE